MSWASRNIRRTRPPSPIFDAESKRKRQEKKTTEYTKGGSKIGIQGTSKNSRLNRWLIFPKIAKRSKKQKNKKC